MAYKVLARKYRPNQFAQVISQTHVVQALANALTQRFLHHAYLFTGTRGVGKTTIARIFAKCLSCEQGISATPCDQCSNCHEIDSGRFPDFYEVDAASRTKVEDTRELLDNVQYAPAKGRYKIYLIDEVHMLSGHSFNALLKTLEEPPEHVKFLLATTDPQKLPPTVLSRCLQFHLHLMQEEQIVQHLVTLLQQEQIDFETAALTEIAKGAAGSMRDALSLLDQCIAFGNGKIIESETRTVLGCIDASTLYALLDALGRRDGNQMLDQLEHLKRQGVDFKNALADLLSILHQANVQQLIPNTSTENKALQSLAQALKPEDVQLFYQIGLMGQRDLAYAPSPQVGFEMTMLRMLAFYPVTQQQTPITRAAGKPAAPPVSAPSAGNLKWHEILNHLKLTGAALALARNCHLHSLTETQAELHVHAKQKPLMLTNSIQRINAALSQYLQRPIKVDFKISEQVLPTPSAITKQVHENNQNKARSAIAADPKIQQLIKTFDATLIEDSITSHENH